jgi:hypothetical protein
MNLGVVSLEDGLADVFEVEGRRCLPEAFFALEDFFRTGNAPIGEEGGMGPDESGLG